MKNKILITFCILFSISARIYSQSIKVKVQNIKNRQGIVYVALCNNADEFMTEKYKELTGRVSANGDVLVDFTKIPQGKYAIRVYQDNDRSGDLTTSFIGIPEEPFGFSNNPRIKMGPPSFEVASFDFKADVNLTINLLSTQ